MGPKARDIFIPLLERPRLITLAAKGSARFDLVRRARILKGLAEGRAPATVAKECGCSVRNVHKWRARWEANPSVDSLHDGARSGRPPGLQMEHRLQVVQLACSQPTEKLAPFRKTWTQQALAAAMKTKYNTNISRSSVQRILSLEGLRPHKVRYWLHSPDPFFREKVRRICQIYVNPPPDAVVLCIDEKPLQVLSRRDRSTAPDAAVRQDYEYARHGVRHLLAALDVRTGKVHGRVVCKRDAKAVQSFLAELARRYMRKHVIVIWDNLNVHHDGPKKRWTHFNKVRYGRFEFVYTPLHASWVNQIEQWFSILQRRVLRHASHELPIQLKRDVEGFISWWNANEKKPFRWTFDGHFQSAPIAA